MPDHVIHASGFNVNLSSDLFRRHARQYLECHRAYKPVAGYSPVSYFLLCRAIELALKAHHLQTKSRIEVKKLYSHNISTLYRDLPSNFKVLTLAETTLLDTASAKYDVPNKGFEYVSLEDVLTAQQSFPEVSALEALAVRLVEA
jgi:hypothetical protein